MTDDIVTRLRSFDSKTDVFFIDKNTFAEAADEIERLREEVDAYKATVRAWEHKWENRKWWNRG